MAVTQSDQASLAVKKRERKKKVTKKTNEPPLLLPEAPHTLLARR